MDGGERPARSVGNYYVLVACGPNHWDRTALGVAVYARGGRLLASRFTDPARAIRRGDLPAGLGASWPPPVPGDEPAMERRRGGAGHAMSCLRWEGPLASVLGPTTAEQILTMLVRGDDDSGVAGA